MTTKEEALRELALRELARRNLKDYVSYVFESQYGTPYVFGKWHDKFFEALEGVRNGDVKRLMVSVPPRAGKSEIISKIFPSFIIGEDQRKNIIAASYGADLANDFGRKAKQICESSVFKNIFPDFSFSKDKKEGGNWETSLGGGMYTVGVQGAITGKGGDILICDDPVKDRQEAESPLIRERVWDWYTSTFYTRKQGEDSAVIIVQTRWNTDDLSGRLIENALKDEGDNFVQLSFPALDENDNSFFPERFSSAYYINERKNIGMRDFSALYQQDPIASSGNIFTADKFRYFAISDLETKYSVSDFEVGIFVDPAFSSRVDSDDAVIIALARHKITKEVYILEIQADTFPPSVATKIPVNMAEKYKAMGYSVRLISVEDVSLNKDQRIFCDNVEAHMQEVGAIFTLHRYKPSGKKEDRIKYTLEPYFDRGAIYFRVDDKGNDVWRKLEEQLLKFPVAKHDDIIDCITQGIQVFESFGVEKESRPIPRANRTPVYTPRVARRR